MINASIFELRIDTHPELLPFHVNGQLSDFINGKTLELSYHDTDKGVALLSVTDSDGQKSKIQLTNPSSTNRDSVLLVHRLWAKHPDIKDTSSKWLNLIGAGIDDLSSTQVICNLLLNTPTDVAVSCSIDIASALSKRIESLEPKEQVNLIEKLIDETFAEQIILDCIQNDRQSQALSSYVWNAFNGAGGFNNPDQMIYAFLCLGSLARWIKANYEDLWKQVKSDELTELLNTALFESIELPIEKQSISSQE